ncbi:MAG: hypothetical protein ACETWG_03835 [Candidatus Neomarinimicrobiota bacterium]
MRKLISIGVVLALLVTFMVPVAVGAQECEEPPCPYTPPEGGPLPAKTTKTLAGAAVWTYLGVQDIMGRAVCATTGQMAGNLGGWSDELGVIAVDVSAAVLDGLADLVEAALEQFLPDFADLGASLGDLLRGIADAIGGTVEE